MIYFTIILISIMLLCGIIAAISKDLLFAVIAAGMASFITAILFVFLQAPDVAMAEASIGAALVTALFVLALKKTKRSE
ncbi:DUF4040 domain-containing protein [bacterium]|nr:DUF4040 domain-containing protein [bacterium]